MVSKDDERDCSSPRLQAKQGIASAIILRTRRIPKLQVKNEYRAIPEQVLEDGSDVVLGDGELEDFVPAHHRVNDVILACFVFVQINGLQWEVFERNSHVVRNSSDCG